MPTYVQITGSAVVTDSIRFHNAFEGSCFLETNWLWWVVTGSEHSVIKPTVHCNDTLYLIIITLKSHVLEGQEKPFDGVKH